MADQERWNEDRERGRLRTGDSDTAWHGADRYPPNDPDAEARRRDLREDEGRRYGAGDYEYGAGGSDDYPRYGSSDRGPDYAPEGRGGPWPQYEPGRDRSGSNWRGEAGPSGRSGEMRGDQGRGGEERGFWDRSRDEVASWFGDRGAEMRRRADGEHRGRGPRGYRRSDDRISEDVHDRLTEDSWLDASDIEVKVHDGEVTLSGRVRTRDDKRRAEDIADRVSGVSHVQNNLRAEDTRQTWSPVPPSYPF